MTRARKKVSGRSERDSGSISLSRNELRTAGIKVGDTVEIEAERDRIVIYRG